MSPTEALQELKQNEHLRNVPEAQLQWLIDHGECRILAAGEAMFRKDDPLDHLQVLLAGCVRVYMVQGG
ncbi:MAG: cyclic nucleotide-binding domain-containing protein, partial [Cytophagales bacterium]|nr:cyclic nucleotide-binding domain-containing protein [Cytophagales bacterium]